MGGGPAGERTREVDRARRAQRPPPVAAPGASPTSAPGCARTSRAATFATEADVDRYCYRVAGTVGLVMAAVLGARDAARARPAAVALGHRDAADEHPARHRRGRSPTDASTSRAEAIDAAGSPRPGQRAELLRDQIAYADALYERGMAGVAELLHGGRAIAAAAAMYREILRQIERDGYGATPGARRVPRTRKLAVAAVAAWRA